MDTPETTGGLTGQDKSASTDEQLPACCVRTIQQHALHNPMMVCTECKLIIKCFLDEKAYRNYLTFCRSRHRKVLTGRVDKYHTIVFRPYHSTACR